MPVDLPLGDRAPAIFLCGPTASGKTALACSLAERFAVELVSVDSAQVYRGLDIGTAKPDAATLARFPHHLIDVAEPTEAYSAARFVQDARAAAQAIRTRAKVPLFVGGTMLYAKALFEGLSTMPPADAEVRMQIEAEGHEHGWPALHAQLARFDPLTAARLQPNDRQRIQRALEVLRLTGRPISALQRRAKNVPGAFAPLLVLGLLPQDRAALHLRIETRFRAMLAGGLIDETARLRATHALDPTMPSMRCVGYRQVWEFLDGAITHAELEARGIAATRQLAKRQMTWMRAMAGGEWHDPFAEALQRRVHARVADFFARL
jgi:tRNA dimethylallyltransferase